MQVEDLLGQIRSYHPGADTVLIRSAWQYAEWAHREQKRKSGDPYFIHPASVAGVIATLRLDAASVCAGLLHDVLEDTPVTSSDLEREFGREIATLVDGVTKLGKVNFGSREDRQAESFRKMVVAMAQDIRVLLVKLCDRLDNMRTLDHMKEESQERIAQETMDIYAPLANRLGIQRVKSELEDLSFRYLQPGPYREITQKLYKSQKERDRYIDGVCKTLSSRLAEHHFGSEVTGRAKHVYSIWRKMQEQNADVESLFDVLAFRVCVESVADCYAVLGVVHSRWTPVPGRFKDYIALPKPNMYQSLHTAVLGPGGQRIEIQIRTHEMHRVAEHGVAAHWRYKERTGGVDPRDAERFGWLRQLADHQSNLRDPAEFLESVKIDLFPEEVYVFTPKGDVKTLPRGATPVDLAFDIHSDVGFRCTGAKANGQIVPLRYKLRNGDVVEILTSPNHVPSKDWLDFVATARAKSRIRGYFRQEQRQKSVNLGRELLETELHAAGVSFTRVWRDEAELRRLCEELRQGSSEELLLAVGYGKLDAHKVAELIRSRGPTPGEVPKALRPGPIEQLVRKVTRKDQGGIKVSGVDDVLVRYARCCNPLPGDAIIGFITRGRGVTVHRRECTKAFDTDPERRIEVSWDSKAKVSRPVQLKVVTANKPGILATVSQTFSAQKLNISEANCRAEDDDRACNVFTFTVSDLTQLRTVMKALEKVSGVVSVERV
ncbi:MAG: bifunctional (p)ppGpp synthetase/guanosine-3',5'-bis(diphosphate) 3'-pyrophosphohydrolase [Polyangiaceae bacterium]|nr:bifunctional (p)ppGpp synthetase/guanosine-3',5'-bis(diphosphate) 3'-pyrophosphohydrolase [Polyangiaceae bacterium]